MPPAVLQSLAKARCPERISAWLAVGLISTITVTVLAGLLAPSPAGADEGRCNDDISKATQRLLGAHEARLERCMKRGQAHCPPYDRGVDTARNKLRNRIGAGGRCDEAVNTGTPLGSLGPGLSCSGLVSSAAACGFDSGQLDDVDDLANCLNCSMDALSARLSDKIASSLLSVSGDEERRCVRSMYRTAVRAVRKGRKEVARCARGGVQPFSCPVSDAADSKFGQALVKLNKRVARCSDSGGVPGVMAPEVMNKFCADHLSETTLDFEECYVRAAKCVTCLYSNIAFGQDQNCTDFSGTSCHETTRHPGMQYVVNRGDETVTLYDDDGSLIAGSLAASSQAVGSTPTDVATNHYDNVIYVTNSADGTVTYLDGRNGQPFLGSLAASTFPTGSTPVAIAFATGTSHRERAVFVLNQGDETVTILHPRSGQPIHGSLVASTFAVGANPTDLAARPQALGDIAIVASNYDDDTVTTFSRNDLDYFFGTLGASTFATGDGPLVVSEKGVLNVLDDTISLLHGSGSVATTGPMLPGTRRMQFNNVGVPPSGYPGNHPSLWAITDSGDAVFLRSEDHQQAGLLAESTFVLGNGAIDMADYEALNFEDEKARYHVLLQTDEELASFHPDLSRNSHLHLTVCSPRRLVVDPVTELAYVLCKNNNLVVLDATTPAFAMGTEAASTFSLPLLQTGSDLAIDVSTGTLYASSYDDDVADDVFGLTIADAATQTPLGGSPFSVGPIHGATFPFPLAPDPVALAINQGTGLVTETDVLAGSVVYLDGVTGGLVGGSKPAATLSLGSRPYRMATSETSDLTCVIDPDDDAVTYIDAAAVGYAGVDLPSSTLATGDRPIDVAANDSAGRFYVANSEDASVTYLTSASVGYAMGTLGASTIPVEDVSSVAVDPGLNTLYAAKDRLVLLDATTGAYAHGTLEDSDYPSSASTMMAVNPTSHILISVSGTRVTYYDGTTGLYLDWGLDVSKQPTGPDPVAVAVMP